MLPVSCAGPGSSGPEDGFLANMDPICDEADLQGILGKYFHQLCLELNACYRGLLRVTIASLTKVAPLCSSSRI